MLQRIRRVWTSESADRANVDSAGESFGDFFGEVEQGSIPMVELPSSICVEKCVCGESDWCQRMSAPTTEVSGRRMGTPADAGMSTVEYAVGTVVAAAFAAVLYRIVTGDSVIAGLTNLINTALSTSF